jgi:polyribonucleotide nucleotidyltransferase
MIEGWAENLENEKFVNAVEYGAVNAYKIVEAIKLSKIEKKPNANLELLNKLENEEKEQNEGSLERNIEKKDEIQEILDLVSNTFQEKAYARIYDIFNDYKLDKKSRDEALSSIRNNIVNQILNIDSIKNSNPALKNEIFNYNSLSEQFSKFVKKIVCNLALEESKRVDGRALNQLRPINCKINLFGTLHGSALFQRGQTQVLCSLTLDSPDAMYRNDAIVNMMSPSITNFDKKFMLHYDFPSFATNEIGLVLDIFKIKYSIQAIF